MMQSSAKKVGDSAQPDGGLNWYPYKSCTPKERFYTLSHTSRYVNWIKFYLYLCYMFLTATGLLHLFSLYAELHDDNNLFRINL